MDIYNSLFERFKSFFMTFIPWSNQSYKFYVKLFLVVLLAVFSFFVPESWFEIRFFTTIYTILFAYLFLNLFFNYLRLVFVNVYLLRNKLPAAHYDNFIIGINKLSFFLNHIIFLVLALTIIGVRVFEILTSLTVVAVALVLIFNDYIRNFMNGTIVMFSKKYRYKDYVKVGDFKGRISDINFMNTELATDTGDVIYIPNNIIVAKEIINFSRKSTKKFSLEFSLNKELVNNYEDIELEVKQVISQDFSLKEEEIVLVVEKFEKDNVLFRFDFITHKYSFKLEKNVKHEVNKILLRYVK